MEIAQAMELADHDSKDLQLSSNAPHDKCTSIAWNAARIQVSSKQQGQAYPEQLLLMWRKTFANHLQI